MGTPDLDMNIADSGKRQKTTKSYLWTDKEKLKTKKANVFQREGLNS